MLLATYLRITTLRREVILQLCRVCVIKVSLMDYPLVSRPSSGSLGTSWTSFIRITSCIDEFESMRSALGKISFIAVDGSKKGLLELLEDRRLRSSL